jgi:hypothetical protein
VTDGPFPAKYTEVMAAVAAAYNIKTSDLKSFGIAPRPIAEGRRALYALLRSECWMSWASIARLMDRNGTNGASWISVQARHADPAAVNEIRSRLGNGHQGNLL